MHSEIKQKMDDLAELRRLGYVTDEEYLIARENLLLDMGFDIVPRVGGLRDQVVIAAPRRRRGCGCGCFLTLLLLLIAAVGGVFAVPEEMLRQVPVLSRLLEYKEYQEVRQALTWFLDDLRGNPLFAPDPAPQATPPAPARSSEPSGEVQAPALHAIAAPVPEGEGPMSMSGDTPSRSSKIEAD